MANAPVRLGRYELLARIGEGGMAEVHLARLHGARQFEKLVVVKTVHSRLAEVPSLIEGLLDEARIAALVKHPNVVDIYDLGEESGTCFIAMEYLAGESLFTVLRQTQRGPRLDRWSVAQIIADGAAGLNAAHELRDLAGERLELVHQDVSPGNVFVLYSGQVKLVDFGVAKVRSTAEDGLVKGKTGYLAPELFDGAPADRRTDVFSLGVVMWEGLTQRRLYSGANERERMAKARAARVAPPSSIMADVGKSLDDICLRALARDPAVRYQTAAAMHDDLIATLRAVGRVGDHDTIGRFMRERFAGEIAAREELLRKVIGSEALAAGSRRPTMPPTRGGHPSQPPPMATGSGPRTGLMAAIEAPTGLGDSRIATAFAADLAAAIERAPGAGLAPPSVGVAADLDPDPGALAVVLPPPRLWATGAQTETMITAAPAPATPALVASSTSGAVATEPGTPTPMLTPVPIGLALADGPALPMSAVTTANLTPVPATALAPMGAAPQPVAASPIVAPLPATVATVATVPPPATPPQLTPFPSIRLAAMTAPSTSAKPSTIVASPVPGTASDRGPDRSAVSGADDRSSLAVPALDGVASRPPAAMAPWSPAPFDGEFDDELDDQLDEELEASDPAIAPMPSPPPVVHRPPAMVTARTSSQVRRRRWLVPALALAAVAAVAAVVLLGGGDGDGDRGSRAAVAPAIARVVGGQPAPVDVASTAGVGSVGHGATADPPLAMAPPGPTAPASPTGEPPAPIGITPALGTGLPTAGELPPSAGEKPTAGEPPLPSATPAPRVPAGPTAAMLYKEGQQSFVIGNYTTALRLYQTAVVRDRRMAVAYRGMGLTYDRLGDRARAGQAFRTYLKLSPRAKDANLIKQRLAKLP